MMPKDEKELKALLKAMPMDDLFDARRLLSAEIDNRKGRSKPTQPVTWPPRLQTR
jgi:hypothetical protein